MTFPNLVAKLTQCHWEKKIEQLCSFIIRSSKYSIVDLCTSRFIEHAFEWWRSRQFRVQIGRKYAIRNLEELMTCMR